MMEVRLDPLDFSQIALQDAAKKLDREMAELRTAFAKRPSEEVTKEERRRVWNMYDSLRQKRAYIASHFDVKEDHRERMERLDYYKQLLGV
jgi:hypothetical protein